MAKIERFEQLEIWQLARELCKMIHSFTKRKDFARNFELINQINASSGSLMDNIAEGFDRGSRKEFVQFLGVAKGSNGEVKSQLYRAFDRQYISETEFHSAYALADTVGGKIHKLIAYLNKSEIKGQKFKDRIEEPDEEYSALSFEFND